MRFAVGPNNMGAPLRVLKEHRKAAKLDFCASTFPDFLAREPFKKFPGTSFSTNSMNRILRFFTIRKRTVASTSSSAGPLERAEAAAALRTADPDQRKEGRFLTESRSGLWTLISWLRLALWLRKPNLASLPQHYAGPQNLLP
jgi:hypothetical protein